MRTHAYKKTTVEFSPDLMRRIHRSMADHDMTLHEKSKFIAYLVKIGLDVIDKTPIERGELQPEMREVTFPGSPDRHLNLNDPDSTLEREKSQQPMCNVAPDSSRKGVRENPKENEILIENTIG